MKIKSKCLTALILVISLVLSISINADSSTYVYYTNKGTPNYNTNNLNILKNTSGTKTYNWANRLFEAGCFITSYAMILRNAKKTTSSSYTDIRKGTTGILSPDPFTVTYANTNFSTITYNQSSGTYVSSYSGDPVATYPLRIASGFNATYKKIDLINSVFTPESTMSLEEKIYWIAYYIKEYPQGVGIEFYNAIAGYHLIVGVETTLSLDFGGPISEIAKLAANNPELLPQAKINSANEIDGVNTPAQIAYRNSTINDMLSVYNTNDITYGEFFTVCDPVHYNSTPGNYVSLNDTWTASAYDLNDVKSIRLMY